ncbi:flagellar basal-body MS-ring/collar protein FliF [uncultured Nisaea sp.]|jgi:flagellar M-ring protein FliF|uniref:flagellar basal-body MS-ring/collar protein FliF n=1 Tax=uncultured Nisaea sp. TaxID=538215 RepID=UPI0030EC9AAB|tara:strand:- start:4926 stop:6617 length:1692 start_codon:yes stop_codon:yes gene_type:complete
MNPLVDLIRNLGPIRIAALVGTAVAVLGFFIFLASRLSTGGMSLLYGDLDPADSGAIVKELESRNIQYELKAGGQQVFVPGDEVLKLRVTLAEQGVPGGGTMGYEIFDKSDGLGTTNFVQNVNLVRALEGELGRTIGAMNNVRGARVHLVLPQRELFSRERRKPSASVVLQVQGAGRLGREQVLAIQHLVAAAVPDMEPQNISILDSRGQLLARGTNDEDGTLPGQSSEEMRLAFENRIRGSVEELVERIVGLGRVRAEISADIDYDRFTEQSEIYDPDSQVARSTQTIEESESSQERNKQDTVSVENNLPEAEANAGNGDLSARSESSRTEETVNFEISRTVRNRVKEAGQIQNLSVAVLVDGRYVENEDGEKVYQPRTEEELEQIATLVRSAVGYNGSRGDTVEVVNMQFVKLEPLDLDDGSLLFGISKDEFLQLAEVLVLAVVGLLVILLVVRPVLTRLFESMPTTLAASGGPGGMIAGADAIAQLTGPGATADMAELLEGDDEEDSLLDQMIDINQVEGRVRASSLKKIGEIVEKHPEEAVAIIRNWMYQEAGNSGAGG